MAVRKVTSRSLSRDGRVVGGELVHYLFSAAVGGFYGGLGESWTWIRWGAGTLFGTGVFVAADELSLPALRLGNKPTDETLERRRSIGWPTLPLGSRRNSDVASSEAC